MTHPSTTHLGPIHKTLLWLELIGFWTPTALLFFILAAGIINHRPILIPTAILGVLGFYGIFRAMLHLLLQRPARLKRNDYWLLAAGFGACNYLIAVMIYVYLNTPPERQPDVETTVAMFGLPQLVALKLLLILRCHNNQT